MRPWQQVLESVDYIVAMVIRRGLMSLDVGVQDTEFLLQTWGLFCHWLKEEGLQTTGGMINSEALNKLEVIILLLQKLNTKLKVFTGNHHIISYVVDFIFCVFLCEILFFPSGEICIVWECLSIAITCLCLSF